MDTHNQPGPVLPPTNDDLVTTEPPVRLAPPELNHNPTWTNADMLPAPFYPNNQGLPFNPSVLPPPPMNPYFYQQRAPFNSGTFRLPCFSCSPPVWSPSTWNRSTWIPPTLNPSTWMSVTLAPLTWNPTRVPVLNHSYVTSVPVSQSVKVEKEMWKPQPETLPLKPSLPETPVKNNPGTVAKPEASTSKNRIQQHLQNARPPLKIPEKFNTPPNLNDLVAFPPLVGKGNHAKNPTTEVLVRSKWSKYRRFVSPHFLRKPDGIDQEINTERNDLSDFKDVNSKNKTANKSKLMPTVTHKTTTLTGKGTNLTKPKCINKPKSIHVKGRLLWKITPACLRVDHFVPPYPIYLNLDDQFLYLFLQRYIPEESELMKYGHPISTSSYGTVVFKIPFHPKTATVTNDEIESVNSSQIMCDRCGDTFSMKSGHTADEKKCVYHYGKVALTENYEPYLTCCKKLPTSVGCSTSDHHVFSGLSNGLNTNLTGYVHSSATQTRGNSKKKVFGIDCEMCFTKMGIELVKVAMVDLQGRQIYCSLVRPENEIVDYNSHFSGVSKDDLMCSNVKSFMQVQKEVIELIGHDTIIIGHALENDLKALKIVHGLVVDTSMIYLHHFGFPFRRTLKDIAKEVLNKNIQENGHNPVEDSRVCVELILKKLQNDFNVKLKLSPN